MVEGWGRLAALISEFHEHAREALVTGRPLDEANVLGDLPARMLSESGRIRELGEQLPDGPELLLATACVDAMLARDLAALDGVSGMLVEAAAAEEGKSLAKVSAEGRSLLTEVGAAFEAAGAARAGGGEPAAPDRDQLLAEVQRATDSLMASAEPVAAELVAGLRAATRAVSATVTETTDSVQVLDQLSGPFLAPGGYALGFLREHAAKVRALLPEQWPLGELAAELDARVAVRPLLEHAAATDAARERVRIWVNDAPMITAAGAEGLRRDLIELENGFAAQMLWTAKSTPWLRRASAPLAHVAVSRLGADGALAVPVVLMLGTARVGFSLADRIDARQLPGDVVKGVVPLVEERIRY